MSAISAFNFFEKKHIQIEYLFEEFEQFDNTGEKEKLVLKICLTLRVHNAIRP